MKVTFSVTVEVDKKEVKGLVQNFVEANLEKQLHEFFEFVKKTESENKREIPSDPITEKGNNSDIAPITEPA